MQTAMRLRRIASHATRRSCAALNAASVLACSASARRSERVRPCASVNNCSSVIPNNGLFSATASDRSSVGSRIASARLIRSMMAICSVSFSRSAPATGTCARLSACSTASNSLPRRRTSTRMSPGRIGRRLSARPVGSCRSIRSLDRVGDARGKLRFRAGFRNRVERRRPAFDVLPFVGFRQIPDIDDAGRRVGQRLVDRTAVRRGVDAAVDRLVLEHRIDRVQDRQAGAEREAEPDVLVPRKLRAFEVAPELPMPPVELVRRCALKREDRLLLVADGEDCARHAAAGSGAGREILGDVRDDLPLPRARVLRLVDQDMIDTLIELVVNPSRGGAPQHVERLVDQVVIVEQAALLLLAAIVRGDRGGDMEQRAAALGDRHARGASRSGSPALPPHR